METDDFEIDRGMVVVGERNRTVHAYTAAGAVQELGTVVTRNYRGEAAQRHYFLGKDDRGKDKTYKLGVTTSQFRFVDHTVALDPLVNRGYVIKDTVLSRGGMHMYALLERPNGAVIHDPMNWDLQFWHDDRGYGTVAVPRELRESIVVFSAIRPGKAITYRRGYHRLICSNGLVAEVMALGFARYNHNNWNGQMVADKIRLLPELSDRLELGEYAGTSFGTARFATLCDKFATLPESPTYDDDGEISGSIAAEIADLPYFIRDVAAPILSQPVWYRAALAQQFEAMAIARSGEKIFALDVVNAVTNPINLERRLEDGHSVLQPLQRSNLIATAATKLIGALSMK